MVVVGGRLGIPGEEPIPVTCDSMSRSVEILWWKPAPQQQQPTGKVHMLNGVMELFNSPHLSDITLIVDDRQIPAHRHVLATHSRMFDRMWNNSMKEVGPVCLALGIASFAFTIGLVSCTPMLECSRMRFEGETHCWFVHGVNRFRCVEVVCHGLWWSCEGGLVHSVVGCSQGLKQQIRSRDGTLPPVTHPRVFASGPSGAVYVTSY